MLKLFQLFKKIVRHLIWRLYIHDYLAHQEVKKIVDLEQTILAQRAKSNSTGCSWGDFLTLYNDVIKYRPKAILELGCGMTTRVLTLAVKKIFEETGEKLILVLVEQSLDYLNEAKLLLPEHLREFVHFHHSSVVSSDFEGQLGVCYEHISHHEYEYVFIDGPVVTSIDGAQRFNAEFLQVLNSRKGLGPLRGVLDLRIHTYKIFKVLLKDCRVSYSVIKRLTDIEWLPSQ